MNYIAAVIARSSLAAKSKLKIIPVISDSYDIRDANNNKINITGKIKLLVILGETQEEIEILISPNLPKEEIILGWQDMISLKIISKHFPIPCKKNMRCCNPEKMMKISQENKD